MAHVLHQVRAAAVTALTGLVTTGARVFVQEPYPWQPAQVPGLVVTTSAAPLVHGMDNPATLQIDVTLGVEAIARGTGDLAAVLDLITSEVMVAVCTLVVVGGKDVSIVPVELAAPVFSGEGDQPVARRLMSFLVSPLFVVANAPDVLV